MTNVAQTLEMLGLSYEDASGEYRSTCPQHEARTGKPDHKPSWYINAQTGLHICFSCGYKGNLVGLVADLKGIDIGQAQAFVVKNRDAVDASAIRKRLLNATTWVMHRDDSQRIPESSLASFTFPPDWAMLERRLGRDAVSDFTVMWEDETGSWVLPIRDPYTHDLWGWQVKGQVTRRYVRNRPKGVAKSRTLFGLNVIDSAEGSVWVVESPLDAVRLHGLGIRSLATFGALISSAQVGLLSAFERVVLALDADDAGRAATDQFLYQTKRMGLDILEVLYPDGCKDPGDCTDNQLLEIRPRHTVRR